ncbi:hypothetical protein BpHYR1_042212 [Brachionus plicatilis]|uniref:Uncharacterized protein n=1 Tax=Brachionus plicatilis TaxID=10195 RepID=A0A3M7QBW3_BRAPC|nr:hypothetical protein BpHYR1_042212 [Brachionus plicatilis]
MCVIKSVGKRNGIGRIFLFTNIELAKHIQYFKNDNSYTSATAFANSNTFVKNKPRNTKFLNNNN